MSMVSVSEFHEYTSSSSVVKGLWDSRLRPQRAVSVDNIFSRSSVSPPSSSSSTNSSNNNNTHNHPIIHERPSHPHRSSSRYRHAPASTSMSSSPQSCLESSLTSHFNLRQGTNSHCTENSYNNNKNERSDRIYNMVSRVMRSCTPRRAKSTCMENSYLFSARPFLSTPAVPTESAEHLATSPISDAATGVHDNNINTNMVIECAENDVTGSNFTKPNYNNNTNVTSQHKWTDSPLQLNKTHINAPLTKSLEKTKTTSVVTKLSLQEPLDQEYQESSLEENTYTNNSSSNRQANGLTDSPSPRIHHHDIQNHYALRRKQMQMEEEEEQEEDDYAHRLFNSHTPRERGLHSEQDMYHIVEMNIDNENTSEQKQSRYYNKNNKPNDTENNKVNNNDDEITILSHEPKYAEEIYGKRQNVTLEKVQQNADRVYIDIDDVNEDMNTEEQQLQFQEKQHDEPVHNYEEEEEEQSRERLFHTLQKMNDNKGSLNSSSSNTMSPTYTVANTKAETNSHQLLDYIKQHQEQQQQQHHHQIISMCRLHSMSNNNTNSSQITNSNNNMHLISHTPSFSFKRTSLGNRTPEAALYNSSSTSAARLRQRQEEQEQEQEQEKEEKHRQEELQERQQQKIQINSVMKKNRETIVTADSVKVNHTRNDENVPHTFVQSQPSHSPLAKSLFRSSLLQEISEHDVAPALTVVLDLDETLVSNRSSGNTRAVLRPYCLHFLHALRHMKNIEIVLWTASTKETGLSVIKQLERGSNIFNEVIFRNSMWFTEPIHTKDLRLLGRPLDRVVIIDNSANCCKLHPRNSILIEEFHGRCSTDDAALVNVYYIIEALLKLINTTNVGVRAGLQKLISEGYLCHSIVFTLPDSWKVLPLSEIAPLKIPPRGKFVRANTLPPSKSIMKYWTY